MKIRNGFVSSSCAFILVLPKRPVNSDELKQILFGDKELIHDDWYDYGQVGTTDLAKRIFSNLKKTKRLERNNVRTTYLCFY